MNITTPGENVFLLTLPASLIDNDEKAAVEATIPKNIGKSGWLILDFSILQMMNGLGAYFLLKLAITANRRGQRVAAFGVTAHYKDVLKITELDQMITIFNNRAEAFTAAGLTAEKQSEGCPVDNLIMDLGFWAKPAGRLSVTKMPAVALNRNVNGLRAVGPVNGFGQLWQKTYRLEIVKNGFTPETIVKKLKENLPAFQPEYNHFYPSQNGIKPGEIVLIDSATPGGPVSTGVLVLYADDVSFTFMTPQGHPESGWVTFSASEANGIITAQITGLARANDPVYEAAFRTVGAKMQVNIWKHVLAALAESIKVPANVTVEPVLVDSHLQWSQTKNVWYNAQIRTLFYAPFHRKGKELKPGNEIAK